jgi:hypothetical protein
MNVVINARGLFWADFSVDGINYIACRAGGCVVPDSRQTRTDIPYYCKIKVTPEVRRIGRTLVGYSSAKIAPRKLRERVRHLQQLFALEGAAL